MNALAKASPRGLLEIGAGTGYWAWYAQQHGIDVIATDPHPPPSTRQPLVRRHPGMAPILAHDHNIVSHQPSRTLLIVWPTKNETWPVQGLDLYAQAGGEKRRLRGRAADGKTAMTPSTPGSERSPDASTAPTAFPTRLHLGVSRRMDTHGTSRATAMARLSR